MADGKRIVVDLGNLAQQLRGDFPAITALWLFGSRRYGTKSLRSDIDVLVCAGEHLRAGDLRQAIRRLCPALDLFVVDGGKAVSCMNDSFVKASTFGELRTRLDAVCIWSTDGSEIDSTAPLQQEIRTDIEYKPSGLEGEPRLGWSRSVEDYFREVAASGIPIKPFLGETVEEIATFIVELTAKGLGAIEQMRSRKTRAKWRPEIRSEYDFQDAFFLMTKPWLVDLGREEVTVRFDGLSRIGL